MDTTKWIQPNQEQLPASFDSRNISTRDQQILRDTQRRADSKSNLVVASISGRIDGCQGPNRREDQHGRHVVDRLEGGDPSIP